MDALKKDNTQVDRITRWVGKRLRPDIRDSHFAADPMSIWMEVKGHPMLRKPQPMTTALKPHNAQKYYEFHKQNCHTTAEYRKLKKALHELTDKG